jgi:hypothetical protein
MHWIVILVLLAALLWCFTKKDREHYGGPVKKIRKSNEELCWKRCYSYYQDCMSKYGHNDAGQCKTMFLDTCPLECHYSNYVRL